MAPRLRHPIEFALKSNRRRTTRAATAPSSDRCPPTREHFGTSGTCTTAGIGQVLPLCELSHLAPGARDSPTCLVRRGEGRSISHPAISRAARQRPKSAPKGRVTGPYPAVDSFALLGPRNVSRWRGAEADDHGGHSKLRVEVLRAREAWRDDLGVGRRETETNARMARRSIFSSPCAAPR